ncbi:hypothetical protein [Rhizobium sp.]|jgi:hypothetical protein|uniref:hypothetical protein n=1 Tax=Rhizobium sp. TaxID=391 RepID=UPI000E8F17AB|nr:hypothetical protein [Rhizobium sp.]
MSKRESLYFAVTGGAALDLCKAHIAACKKSHQRNCAIATELGASKWQEAFIDGAICAVVFDGKGHPDFKTPNKHGGCAPKKNTEWHRKFLENRGYDKSGAGIAKTLGIPTYIDYTMEGGEGWQAIGGAFSTGVGFLWLSDDGPFALYTPDIAAIVAEHESRGHVVGDPAKSFKPVFDGAQPIEKEEWEILVLQQKLAEKRAALNEGRVE